jgi:hypothetical protein
MCVRLRKAQLSDIIRQLGFFRAPNFRYPLNEPSRRFSENNSCKLF